MIVHVMFVCISFLISVYVYYVENFAHIECYSDCSRRGCIFLEPISCYLMYVVPSLWSVVFCTRVAWVCLVCLLYSSVFEIIEIRDRGLYEVPLSASVGFWDGDFVS